MTRTIHRAVALLAAALFAAPLFALAWTGPTATAPSGNVSAPINVGSTAQTKSGDLTANNIYTNAWFRVNGSNGIYWQNYGGGWYMQDTTWLRTYGNKGIWAGTGNIGTNGGLTIGYGGAAVPAGSASVSGGVTAGGEITGTMTSGYGQIRMIHGSYGSFWRNDGSNTYFLLTNAGDQYGGWNTLRPFYVNDSNGNVTIGTNLCLGGVCKGAWPSVPNTTSGGTFWKSGTKDARSNTCTSTGVCPAGSAMISGSNYGSQLCDVECRWIN